MVAVLSRERALAKKFATVRVTIRPNVVRSECIGAAKKFCTDDGTQACRTFKIDKNERISVG